MSIEVIASHEDSMSHPEPGLRRQVMSSSPSMMLVRHRMKKGWGGKARQPQEQMVYIVSGHLSFQHPGGVVETRMGDSFLVPAMWNIRPLRSKTPKFWTSSLPGAKTTRRLEVRV
jgi:hypothetical protein